MKRLWQGCDGGELEARGFVLLFLLESLWLSSTHSFGSGEQAHWARVCNLFDYCDNVIEDENYYLCEICWSNLFELLLKLMIVIIDLFIINYYYYSLNLSNNYILTYNYFWMYYYYVFRRNYAFFISSSSWIFQKYLLTCHSWIAFLQQY